MRSFLSGVDINLDIAFTDDAGAEFVATAAEYRLVDGAGNELVARTAIPGFTGGSSATIAIPGALNTLDTGQVRDARVIELWLTNASGVIGQTETYLIELHDVLVIPDTSFVTYAGAEAVAAGLPNMTGWASATREQKTQALMEATRRLKRMRYRIYRDNMAIVEPSWPAGNMELITLADWNAFYTEFKTALQMAEVIQADRILSNDENASLQKYRESGLMSMTVGESSNMFRPGKPLMLPVCRDAMNVLGRYISWRHRISR